MYKNKHTRLLFFGDLVTFFVSIYFTLLLRYLVFPTKETIIQHLLPFSLLIFTWCLVFLIAGLYEQHILILRRNLARIIINTQILNCIIAALFFYFIPYFSLSPKTVLFIYLFVSLGLILFWRLFIFQKITSRFMQKTIVIGEGNDVSELVEELKRNPSYGISVAKYIPSNEINNTNFGNEIGMVVGDFSKEELTDSSQKMYGMLFSGVQFVKLHDLYESMFGRIPMSLLHYNWFISNVSNSPKIAYKFLKRFIDIILSILIGIPSLLFYPFVALAIKIEDGGKIFIKQERIGENGIPFQLYKFRSMNVDDGGKWIENNDARHTKVGKFIRDTRIDELPQLWNLFLGDISLIGPRPDIKKLWQECSNQIPYYQIRNIVKPGLSGWAQITQDVRPQNLEDTKIRLSYDLYYIKHRSLLLDLKIGIRTIKTLLSRSGA